MPADEGVWGDIFAGRYRHARCRNQQRRARRRARRQDPSPKAEANRRERLAAAKAHLTLRYEAARENPDFTAAWWDFIRAWAKADDPDARLLWRADCEPIAAEQRQQRHAIRRMLIQQRLSRGFEWAGGTFGGNPDYFRQPFNYPDLVSNEHFFYKFFVASTPRATRLRTGNTKAAVTCEGQKLLALDNPYVETNRCMRRVFRVDLDQSFAGGVQELAAAVAHCGVPPPNIIVGHIDRVGQLLNPHLLWLIEHGVGFGKKHRKAPQALWTAVLRGLTAQLLPIGADPGGIANPLRVKNPLSPLWHSTVLAAAPYTLAPDNREDASGLIALVPHLGLEGTQARLQLAALARRGKPLVADHPDPDVASQSNGIFQSLSGYARDRLAVYRAQGDAGKDGFHQELLEAAQRIVPAGGSAARQAAATADRVAQWTWNNYNPRSLRSPCDTPEERHARQAAGQAKGAKTKRNATLAQLIAAAQRIIDSNQRPTQSAVIQAVDKGERTVRHYWPAILAAIKPPPSASCEPAVQVAIDKKVSVETTAPVTQPKPRPLPGYIDAIHSSSGVALRRCREVSSAPAPFGQTQHVIPNTS